MRNNFRVDEVEEAAAAWLLKRERVEWSAADEAALTEWLEASMNHRVAFLRLMSVWREADRMKVLRAGLPPGDIPPRGAIGQSPFFTGKARAAAASAIEMTADASTSHHRRLSFKFGLAASVLLAIAVAVGAYRRPPEALTYRTAIGGLATVPMSDGSKITLNTATEITLQVTNKERRVNLTQGEAFFDVAKDPSRPFVVYADGQRVIAVGTKFAVRLKPEAVQVTVTEGRVRLEQQRSFLNLIDGDWISREAGTTERRPVLTPGTVARANDEIVSIEQQPVADVEHALSWRSGYVVLRDAYLRDAIAEFNRYNEHQLVIADASLAEIQIGGNFQASNVDGFVRLLEEGFGIQAQERDGRIVLTRH